MKYDLQFPWEYHSNNIDLMKPIEKEATQRTINATTQFKNFLIKKLEENKDKHIFKA